MPNFSRIAATSLMLLLASCGGRGITSAQPSPNNGGGISMPAGVERFGEDRDSNGIPDRLERAVAASSMGPLSKVAALNYFKQRSALAVKAMDGATLSDAEKQRYFDSISCLLETAKHEGLPRIDADSIFMETRVGFNGAHALMGALNGSLLRVTSGMDRACEAAK